MVKRVSLTPPLLSHPAVAEFSSTSRIQSSITRDGPSRTDARCWGTGVILGRGLEAITRKDKTAVDGTRHPKTRISFSNAYYILQCSLNDLKSVNVTFCLTNSLPFTRPDPWGNQRGFGESLNLCYFGSSVPWAGTGRFDIQRDLISQKRKLSWGSSTTHEVPSNERSGLKSWLDLINIVSW